jgi:serine/threonine protein kinase
MADERRCPRCGAVLPAGGGECTRCLLALGLTEGLTPQTDPGLSSPDPGAELPERIGAYRILDTLGSGGMGVVYLAEQEEPVRRRVALKVVRPGLDSGDVLGRFAAERQALALMDHPGIAKVFDAGTTDDGRPYFAMEWVAGVPITEYCDRERLTSRQRLELFVEVCEAIQHAHTKGVLHRDVKPSNVLVTEAEGRARPKVIDFGVAKALGPKLTEQTLYTALGVLVGTPGYMSPEQSEPTPAGVDTRSDIYSLGVLLYELLVGEPPFEPRRLRKAGWAGMVRIIQHEEPPRPSRRVTTLAGATATDVAERRRTEPRRLARELRGDLDWIVLKALEKDRSRRYQSASGLGLDIQRHLRDEPVVASPPSLVGRIGRALRRLRLVLAALASMPSSLLAGLVASTVL